MNFKRKDFLLQSLALVGAGVSCKPSSKTNLQTDKLPYIVWRIASSYPRGLDTIFMAAETFVERIKLLSGGRFTIRVFPAGELVPGLQVMDSVQNGTVQMGHTASYYFTGKNPALAFDCGVPFGLTARQQNAWLYYGGGRELLDEVFAKFNIISFPGGNTGTQMGGWFREEVRSLADLKGLKMRIPGLGGQVMDRLGVNVQVLPGGEIYPALERGAIDATEWVGPYDDEKLGFYKIAKNYYYPGWWEPGAQISFYVNRDEWNQLPLLYQEMIRVASMEANTLMLARYDVNNPAALQRLISNGVQLKSFSQEILEEAYKVSFAIMEENALKDILYKKIYDSWLQFRNSSFQWLLGSEASYLSFLGSKQP